MAINTNPSNANELFDFSINNIHAVELEDWPDNEIKRVSNWETAVAEFNKHISFISELKIGSPYPINSFSVGAAEIRGEKFHVRLFLFPMNKPSYQYEAVGQIICEFPMDANTSDIDVWTDFLDTKEINEETGKIVLIQITLRWIKKLMNDFPQSIQLLRMEAEINNLKLPSNPEESSRMFYLEDVAEVVNFIRERIAAGDKIAIYFPDKIRGAFIVGKDLF